MPAATNAVISPNRRFGRDSAGMWTALTASLGNKLDNAALPRGPLGGAW